MGEKGWALGKVGDDKGGRKKKKIGRERREGGEVDERGGKG